MSKPDLALSKKIQQKIIEAMPPFEKITSMEKLALELHELNPGYFFKQLKEQFSRHQKE